MLFRSIKEKEMNVTISGTCSEILADKFRMTQVVINLLSNAIKYTQPRGRIRIELSESNDEVLMKFIDNGTGISIEELPNIFERFYRADKSRNRLTGGSGIGLTIVKSIVNAHGGSIEVKSEPGLGSEFTVHLPK